MSYDPSVVVTKPTLASLRANLAAYQSLYLAGKVSPGDGGAGLFTYDASDTTSADDGWRIIVDAAGHRFIRTASNDTWKRISSNYSAAVGDLLDVSTSGGTLTVILPASPSNQDRIGFNDIDYNWSTTSFTISRNGNLIQGVAADLNANMISAFLLVYSLHQTSWVIQPIQP